MKLLALLILALKPLLGLDLYMPVPESNPLTRDKVELGRRLFFDKRLSRDRTIACVTCHDPTLAFSDGRVLARGIDGAEGTRNAPALINRGYGSSFFWDGRAKSLEQQALEPILNPRELGLTEGELEQRTKLKTAEVTAALASCARTIRSGHSRFDRYTAGQPNAINALEKAGLAVFRGRGNCSACHPGPNFTDEQFHNTGVAWRDGALADRGAGQGRFKTPTLREVSRTAPYMHDGSLTTLEDVIEFYSEGGRPNPNLDVEIRPRNFTPEEKRALLAFLQTLTGRVREGW